MSRTLSSKPAAGLSCSDYLVVGGGIFAGLVLGGFLLRGNFSSDTARAGVPGSQMIRPHGESWEQASPPAADAIDRRNAAWEDEPQTERATVADADPPDSPDLAPQAAAADSPPRTPRALSAREMITGFSSEGEFAEQQGLLISGGTGSAPSSLEGLSRPGRSSAPASAAGPRNEPSARSSPAVSAGQATLDYWHAMNAIIAKEAAMRSAPAKVTAGNAAGFVESRIQAGQFAAAGIRNLETANVDSEVVSLGRDLIAWYQDEVSLNERARSLLGSSDIAARKGAAGNSWRSGEEQHRKTCDDINRRGADLRSRLSRKYGLAFPPLN